MSCDFIYISLIATFLFQCKHAQQITASSLALHLSVLICPTPEHLTLTMRHLLSSQCIASFISFHFLDPHAKSNKNKCEVFLLSIPISFVLSVRIGIGFADGFEEQEPCTKLLRLVLIAGLSSLQSGFTAFRQSKVWPLEKPKLYWLAARSCTAKVSMHFILLTTSIKP